MKLLGTIPRVKFIVACSGGMDSMVLVDFLDQYPQNNFELAFFNHGTSDCDRAQKFLSDWCYENKRTLHIGKVNAPKAKDESMEEYWRNQRYGFLDTFACPVLTAHHLDDVVESWVMSSLKGGISKLIPYRRGNIIRPFLLVSKQEITDWANRNGVEYVEDYSNENVIHLRNYIRHQMMPHVLHVNPGIRTMIRRKLIIENKEIE